VQPVHPFLKFDIFGSFLRFGDPAEGGRQVSSLFHEDDQDDQINLLIILLGGGKGAFARSFCADGPREWFAKFK
jgi:hypothetical protein